MDASENDALIRLGEQDQWGTPDLPDDISTDVLRGLDLEELIDVGLVIMQNQQKFPGDPTPPVAAVLRWFSPLAAPKVGGDWDTIRNKPPHVPRPTATVKSGFSEPAYYVRLNERGRAVRGRLLRAQHDFEQVRRPVKSQLRFPRKTTLTTSPTAPINGNKREI